MTRHDDIVPCPALPAPRPSLTRLADDYFDYAVVGRIHGSALAFGDKRGMLIAALDHYAEQNLARLAESLRSAELSREGLRSALLYYTRTATTLSGNHGCLVTNTALEMIPDDREVAERVERIFRRMVALLTAAIVRGQAAGIFNPELDERAIENYLLCAIQGLRVLGKVNHDEQELVGIVDMVMRALD